MDIDSILVPLAKEDTTLDEVKELDPLRKYNGEYGNGFMKPDTFLSIVYMNIYNHIDR